MFAKNFPSVGRQLAECCLVSKFSNNRFFVDHYTEEYYKPFHSICSLNSLANKKILNRNIIAITTPNDKSNIYRQSYKKVSFFTENQITIDYPQEVTRFDIGYHVNCPSHDAKRLHPRLNSTIKLLQALANRIEQETSLFIP